MRVYQKQQGTSHGMDPGITMTTIRYDCATEDSSPLEKQRHVNKKQPKLLGAIIEIQD